MASLHTVHVTRSGGHWDVLEAFLKIISLSQEIVLWFQYYTRMKKRESEDGGRNKN